MCYNKKIRKERRLCHLPEEKLRDCEYSEAASCEYVQRIEVRKGDQVKNGLPFDLTKTKLERNMRN